MKKLIALSGICAVAIVAAVAMHDRSSQPDAAESEGAVVRQELPQPATARATSTLDVQPEMSASPSGRIIFPDGTAFTVQFRKLPPVPGMDGESLRASYAALRAASLRGDGRAAYDLFLALEHCANAFEDEKELERAVTTLYQTRRVAGPHSKDLSNPEAGLSPEAADLEEVEQSALRQPYAFCRDITPEQKQERDQWLNIAVEGNQLYAIMHKARLAGHTNEAVVLWLRAWNAGRDLAADWISKLYEEGVSGPEGVRTDLVTAYAYRYVHVQFREAAYRTMSPETLRHPFHLRSKDRLAALELRLTPYEKTEAIREAARILSANEECCFFP